MWKLPSKASRMQSLIAAAMLAGLTIAATDAFAQKSDAEIALAALNPLASMISLPFQYNYDRGYGRQEEGHRNLLNIQPVIPISISHDWNLITRTIVPLISQDDLIPGTGSQSGLGDITASLFFSPKKPTSDGWIWGAGPVFYLPTARDNLLGADKWGLGPTAVFLKQADGWTYGALVNHLWSVGGSGRADISNTFLQPFLSYTTKDHISFKLNTESTYNWESDKWSVPIHAGVSKMLSVGQQRLQLEATATYWAATPDVGPHGWGGRFVLTFLFPE